MRRLLFLIPFPFLFFSCGNSVEEKPVIEEKPVFIQDTTIGSEELLGVWEEEEGEDDGINKHHWIFGERMDLKIALGKDTMVMDRFHLNNNTLNLYQNNNLTGTYKLAIEPGKVTPENDNPGISRISLTKPDSTVRYLRRLEQ